MINRMFSSIAVMVALGILTPIQVHAFGLGKLELSSALNEAFKAEIPVTALREDEQGNLQVRLASSSEFKRAGLERNFFLTRFTFTVVEKANSTVIEVSSVQPVKEPFIGFLITATTGEGRLLREYTVLLDPPKSLFVKPVKAVPPAKVKSSSSTSNNKTTYQYPDSGYEPSSVVNHFSGNSYGATKRNDTLWAIAQQTKPASVSIDQMMIATLNANPNAFINNNINILKIGQILTIPSRADISSLSQSQAVARVAEQTAQWKNAANIAAVTTQQTSDTMPAESDGKQSSTESGDTALLQLVVADDTATGNNDLSPLGSDALTKLKAQLTLAQETIEGQEQETIDFKARMDAMEQQLTIMRKIISLKDSDLARLQGILGDEQQVELASDELSEEMQAALEENDDIAVTDEVESGFDTSMAENSVAAERMIDEAAIASAAKAARAEAEFNDTAVFVGPNVDVPILIDEADFNSNDGAAELSANRFIDEEFSQARVFDEAAVAAAAAAAKAEEEYRTGIIIVEDEVDLSMDEVDVDTSVAVEPTEEVAMDLAEPEDGDAASTGLVDKIKTVIAANKLNILYGLGGLFVVLLVWLFIRRGKQSDYEWLESDSLQDIDASEVELTEAVVAENRESTQVDIIDEEIEEEVILTDTLSADLTDETPEKSVADLLNQAEMSIAYGEYKKAHIMVEKARQQEPANQDVTLKLIALAYHQQQAEEFSKLAGEIDIDKDSAAWLEVVEWGKDLVPENPLFTDNAAEELSSDLDNNPSLDAAEAEFSLEDSALDNNSTDDALSFNTDFDLEDKSADADEASPATVALDSDTDSGEMISEDDQQAVLETDLTALLEEGDETLAFDLDEPMQDDEPEATDAVDPVEKSAIDADDLDFDIGDFDEVDEAETKLDLAVAYVEMGDPNGAKNILDEVLKEGNDDQKSRAQDLLNNLA